MKKLYLFILIVIFCISYVSAVVPSISNVSITPSVLYKNSTLQGWCNINDSDSTNVVISYQWFKNNVLNQSTINIVNYTWVSNNTLGAGLNTNTYGSTWIMYNLTGSGKFQALNNRNTVATANLGYDWNGSGWTTNSSVTNGLPTPNYAFSGVAYNFTGRNKYDIFVSSGTGTFNAYEFNGTSWVLNNSMFNGVTFGGSILDIGTPNVGKNITGTNKWQLFIATMNLGTYSYEWNGTSWESNSTIQNGLSIDYNSNIFYNLNNNGKWMFSTGYLWNGSTWYYNASYLQGLSFSPSFVFNLTGDSKYKAVNSNGNQGASLEISPYSSNTLINLQNFTNSFVKGDNIIFSCQGYDGINYTNWTNSSSSSINNFIPTINVSFNPSINVYKNSTILGLCNYTDVDGDNITYFSSLYQNNTLIDGYRTNIPKKDLNADFGCYDNSTNSIYTIHGNVYSNSLTFLIYNITTDTLTTNIVTGEGNGNDYGTPTQMTCQNNNIYISTSQVSSSIPPFIIYNITSNTLINTNYHNMNYSVQTSILNFALINDNIYYIYDTTYPNNKLVVYNVTSQSLNSYSIDSADARIFSRLNNIYLLRNNDTSVIKELYMFNTTTNSFNNVLNSTYISWGSVVKLYYSTSDDIAFLFGSNSFSKYNFSSKLEQDMTNLGPSGWIDSNIYTQMNMVYNTQEKLYYYFNKNSGLYLYNLSANNIINITGDIIVTNPPRYLYDVISTNGVYRNIFIISKKTTLNDSLSTYTYKATSSNNILFNFTNVSKNNNLTLECQVFDGTNYSSKLNSSQITVLNSPPYLSTITINNTSPRTNDMENCLYTGINDIDGDTVTIGYGWLLNSVLTPNQYNSYSNFSLTYSGYNKGSNVQCQINLSDGTNSTYWNTSISIINNSNTTGNSLINISNLVLGQNISIIHNISSLEVIPTQLNFTVIRPNGSYALQNSAGINTTDSMIWNSSSFLLDQSGVWNYTLTYFDNTEFGNFTVNDNYSVSPTNESTSFGSGVLHQLPIYITHNGNPSLNFTYKIVISNQSNWTIQYTNTTNTTFNLTLSNNMPDGVYTGYIEVYRSIDNKLLQNISLNYSISLLSGKASISKNNTATTFATYSDESFSYTHTVNNTGNYILTNCSAYFEGIMNGASFKSFTWTNTSIPINSSVNLTVLFVNVPVSTISDLLQIKCIANNFGILSEQLSVAEKPSYVILSALRPVAPTGGGGGGSPTTIIQQSVGVLGDLTIEPANVTLSMTSSSIYNGEIKITNTGLLNKNISIEFLKDGFVTFDQDVSNLIVPTSSGVVSNFIYVRYTIKVPVNQSLGQVLTSTYIITDLSTDKTTNLVFTITIRESLFNLLLTQKGFFNTEIFSQKICLEPDTCSKSITVNLTYGYALLGLIFLVLIIVGYNVHKRYKK